MSNIFAGIGRGQIEVLDKHMGYRRAMHDFYKEIFRNNQEVLLFEELSEDYFSNHWLSAIFLRNYQQREGLRIHLEKANIKSRHLWKPMHLQPVFEKYPYYGTNVSEDLFERGLCLPSGSNLRNEDRDRIQLAIATFFRKQK